jgi:glyoxylase-like metal-dependent hydrolase (beta-lactamase superfamily II)
MHWPQGKGMQRLIVLVLITVHALSVVRAEELPMRYPPTGVDMQLERLSDHVYLVRGEAGVATDNEGFISNAGVIVTTDGVVVFDALGTPSLADRMLGRIRELTDKPIVRVIASHYHADHIYGLQVFEEQGAEVWAPVGAEKYLRSQYARERLEERRFSLDPWVNESTRLVEPDRYISAQVHFELGGVRFTVSPVGAAHSDGDLTLYVEPDRILFSGDIIFDGRVPFMGDANSRHWLEVVQRMEEQQLVALVPGHGAVAADPNRAVASMRHYLSYLRQTMAAAVDEFIPFDAAYAATDWSEFEDSPAFEAVNRRNAYQVYLSIEAESLGD